MPPPETAIGGYLPLELGPPGRPLHRDAIRFQSARAALVALLRTAGARRLWLPRLICDSVPAAAARAGAAVSFYSLDPADGTPAGVDLARGDLLLYVNLFGVMGRASRSVLERFARDQVVLDHAQAYFEPAGRCLATLYSPRKFFGVPDGGLLATDLPVPIPNQQDHGSVDRCRHLLRRLGSPPEEGYAEFQAAEATLDDAEPLAMSALTERLLASADQDGNRRRRRSNFAALHRRLREENHWPFPLPSKPAALCYPFLRDVAREDARMRAQRLFVPTYWPEARSRCPPGSVEALLLERLLPLPIDQRYEVGPGYMARLAGAGVTSF